MAATWCLRADCCGAERTEDPVHSLKRLLEPGGSQLKDHSLDKYREVTCVL